MAIFQVPRFRQAAARPAPAAAAAFRADGLDAFDTESTAGRDALPAPGVAAPADASRPPSTFVIVTAIGAIAAIIALGIGAFWAYRTFVVSAPSTASLSLQTSPAGAEVTINGKPSGTTPLSTTLPAGAYQVHLKAPSGQERTIDVDLQAGQSVIQQIEWAVGPAAVSATAGALHVQTEPAGQVVVVDDVRRGTSPLTVSGLSPGRHRLVVSGAGTPYRRDVTITAGNTLSLTVSPRAAGSSAGWLRISAPILLQIRANGELVGNTEVERVMLPAGEHTLEMRNDAFGFSATRRVTVAPGRTADLRVAVPNGTLSINAIPWAEVWLNGERVGETPLANLSRPIGNYQVTLRHPQLGERQASVTVSVKDPARLGVDMRQK